MMPAYIQAFLAALDEPCSCALPFDELRECAHCLGGLFTHASDAENERLWKVVHRVAADESLRREHENHDSGVGGCCAWLEAMHLVTENA